MKNKSAQKGFARILILCGLGLAIVFLIVGYMVYKRAFPTCSSGYTSFVAIGGYGPGSVLDLKIAAANFSNNEALLVVSSPENNEPTPKNIPVKTGDSLNVANRTINVTQVGEKDIQLCIK